MTRTRVGVRRSRPTTRSWCRSTRIGSNRQRPRLASAHASPMALEGDRADDAGRLHRIPVRYGGADGPDLDAVADRLGPRYRRRSSSSTPRSTIGSSCSASRPASATSARCRPRCVVPRRDQPRPRVPAGSVAIAGSPDGHLSLVDTGRLAPHRPDRRRDVGRPPPRARPARGRRPRPLRTCLGLTCCGSSSPASSRRSRTSADPAPCISACRSRVPATAGRWRSPIASSTTSQAPRCWR